MARRKALTLSVVLTEHVFDKVRSIDMTLAEFEEFVGDRDVIEEQEIALGHLKELVLVIDWKRPLHVVIIVDGVRGEERVLTDYEPDPDRWSHAAESGGADAMREVRQRRASARASCAARGAWRPDSWCSGSRWGSVPRVGGCG